MAVLMGGAVLSWQLVGRWNQVTAGLLRQVSVGRTSGAGGSARLKALVPLKAPRGDWACGSG